jgi:non-specific protein-tyrosine kinase
MDTTTLSEDLRRYTALLWHWAWLLVLLTVLGGAAAFIISKRTVPVYQASTRLLINEAPATKSTDYASVLASERLARTYSELLTTKPVLDNVISRLGISISEQDLRSAIRVNLLRDTQLIDVSVEDTNPGRAAEVANAIVDVFSEQNQALQTSRFSTSKESLSAQLAEVDLQIESANTALESLGEGEDDKAERDRLDTALAQYRQTYASLLQSYESVRLAEATSISNVVQV